MCCSVLHKQVMEFSLTWKFLFPKILFIQNFRDHVVYLPQILEKIYLYACEIRILQDYCKLIKLRVLPSVHLFLFPALILAFSTFFSLFSLFLLPSTIIVLIISESLQQRFSPCQFPFFNFILPATGVISEQKKITGKNYSPNILLGKVELYYYPSIIK